MAGGLRPPVACSHLLYDANAVLGREVDREGKGEEKGWVLFAGLARVARIAGKCASLLESCGPCCAEGPTLIVL